MLKSIEIKGYRCFEQYRMEGLSRVNLLVGKNNCGKTALLEAVWLAVSEGDPQVLLDIAERRGEVILIDDQEPYGTGSDPPGTFVDHFFHGHTIDLRSSFSLSSKMQSGKDNTVSFTIADVIESPDRFDIKTIFQKSLDFPGELRLAINNSNAQIPSLGIPIVLSKETQRAFRNRRKRDRKKAQYVFPEITRSGSLNAMWTKVLREGRKSDVIEAMQILDPNVLDVDFIPTVNRFSKSASDSVIIALVSGERLPLGTLGDGMRYLLGLAISLVQADGGVILIDEIDTGLHYSVMGDLWQLVVETAKQRNIQVFATTHSQDCVRGLARLCEYRPELRQEVSLQTIDPELEKAVDLDGDGIILVVDQDIEVR